MQSKKVIILFLMTLLLGFVGGKLYGSRNRDAVYTFNQERFIKLVALSVAAQSPDNTEAAKVLLDKNMKQLSNLLRSKYTSHPLLITLSKSSQNKSTCYGLYGNGEKVDITEEIIIKIIGEDKWKEIGSTFLN